MILQVKILSYSHVLEPVYGRYVTIQKVRKTLKMNFIEVEIDSGRVNGNTASTTSVMMRSDVNIEKVK